MFEYLSYTLFIIKGSFVILKYSILSIILATIIAGFIYQLQKKIIWKFFANIYIFIFQNTPLLLQFSIIYLGISQIMGIKFSMFVAGVITFSLNSSVYLIEIIKTIVNNLDKEQINAAKALSIGHSLIMKDIVLPQIIKNIFPLLINEFINIIKNSAILSIFGEMDLIGRAELVSDKTSNYFIPLISAACCYYFLIKIINVVSAILQKKLVAN